MANELEGKSRGRTSPQHPTLTTTLRRTSRSYSHCTFGGFCNWARLARTRSIDCTRSRTQSRNPPDKGISASTCSSPTHLGAIVSPNTDKMDAAPPRLLYRVQSARSYTAYKNGSFSTQACWLNVDPCHWITRAKISEHLRWSASPHESTPFISVFDNFGMLKVRFIVDPCSTADDSTGHARQRAALLVARGHREVFIAAISVPTPDLRKIPLRRRIQYVQGRPPVDSVTDFPIWEQSVLTSAGEEVLQLFSTDAARRDLGVEVGQSQRSEWFVIDEIPSAFVVGIISYST